MQQQTASPHKVLRSQPDMLAGVTSILVKEILDLREMLTFYELELCKGELDERRGAATMCHGGRVNSGGTFATVVFPPVSHMNG